MSNHIKRILIALLFCGVVVSIIYAVPGFAFPMFAFVGIVAVIGLFVAWLFKVFPDKETQATPDWGQEKERKNDERD